jgi:hypothetical protein
MVVAPNTWYFDQSDSLVIVESPTTTPFYHVLVYKQIKRCYRIVCNTSFSRHVGEDSVIEYDAHYKQFLPMKYVSHSKSKRVLFDLFDVMKGTFSGNLVIPANDICNMAAKIFSVKIGFQGKAVVSCKIGGHLKATLYSLAGSNKTGEFQLVLKNAVTVLLRSRPEVLNGDIYTSGVSKRGIYVSSYRKENWYQPVNYFIKLSSSLLLHIDSYTLKFNFQFNLLIILGFPGPWAIGLKEVYKPMHGLVNNGASKHAILEIMIYFRPKSADQNFHDFHFDLGDSFFHMIRSRGTTAEHKEYFKFIDVYDVVM